MLTTAKVHDDDVDELINLSRYPVADLSSAGAMEVIAEGRAQLARDGLCLMPDFVTPAAVDAMASEARALEPTLHHALSWMAGNGRGPNGADLHRPTRNSCGSIPYDRLASDSLVRRLYELDQLVELFRELLRVPAFYRCADPISSCLLMYYYEGDELGWHFDPNDGVVTLLLQAAEEGGDFEFVPNVGRDPENFDPFMDGRRDGVITPTIRPGTLALFQGVNSLHRVTPVKGPVPRIMLTMSFHDKPGMVFSAENRRRYSGRNVDAHGQTV